MDKRDERRELLAQNPQLAGAARQNTAARWTGPVGKLARAVTSERQLNEVMVDFWENHFSVFAGKGQTRMFLAQYDRDVIRPNALGKFRDLLGAVAKSPAMLFFLDNWQSAADSTQANAGGARRRPRRSRWLASRHHRATSARRAGGSAAAGGARATPERHARGARAADAALAAAGASAA